MRFDELLPAESQLWRCFARGALDDVSDSASAEATVRAEVLAALLLGAGLAPIRATVRRCT